MYVWIFFGGEKKRGSTRGLLNFSMAKVKLGLFNIYYIKRLLWRCDIFYSRRLRFFDDTLICKRDRAVISSTLI